MSEYKFDFSGMTAEDASYIMFGPSDKIASVVNKAVVGGLKSYKPEELRPIFSAFSEQWFKVFNSPIAKAIVSAYESDKK